MFGITINPKTIYKNELEQMDKDIKKYLPTTGIPSTDHDIISNTALKYRLWEGGKRKKYLIEEISEKTRSDKKYVKTTEEDLKKIYNDLLKKKMDHGIYNRLWKNTENIIDDKNIDKIIVELNKIPDTILSVYERDDIIKTKIEPLKEIKKYVDGINGKIHKGTSAFKAAAPATIIGLVIIDGAVYAINNGVPNIQIPDVFGLLSGSENTAPAVVSPTNCTDIAHGATEIGNASANATNHTTNWNIQNVGDNSYILERIEPDGLGSTKVAVTNIEHIGKIASNVTEKSSQFLMENISFNEPTPEHPVYINTSITK